MPPPIAPTCDVVIVGAGPAGAAAAVVLGRAGLDVQVVDKATFPRDKCCGDGLTTLALRELEQLGLDPADVPNWFDVDGAVLRAPSGREFKVPLEGAGVFAATAPRRELDAALVRLAGEAGARVQEGWAFTGLTRHADSLTVSFRAARDATRGEHHVTARWVIAADGMWSPVRKAAGVAVPGYRGEWHAFRQYARGVTGRAARELIVWFEPDLLPGYAWSFPLPNGRVNLGFGVLRSDQRPNGATATTGPAVGEMGDLWRDLLARQHIVAALGPGYELEGRHTAWPIPARIDSLTLATERILFVGDAAAATDVMTGEGIGQALETGRLAAEAIIQGGDVAEAYSHAVRQHLFADHRMSVRLGRVLARTRGANAALRIVEHSGAWGRRKFARWMFEDEPRAIALTPRRWHRRVLRRPGAYVSRSAR